MAPFGVRHLTLLLVFAAWMAGCTGTSSAPSALSTPPAIAHLQVVDSFDIAKDTFAIGQTLHLSGMFTDDQALKKWTLTILDSEGKVVDTVGTDSILGTSFSFDQIGSYLPVLNDGSWGPNGRYTIRLTVANLHGDLAHVDLKVNAKGIGNGTSLVGQGVRQIGAQGAISGSFLDAARDSVWKSGSIPYRHIDFVFGLDANNQLALMSPAVANGDGFNLGGTWDQLNITNIVFYSAATPQLNSAWIQAAIGDASTAPQKAFVQTGWYALKLSDQTYAALDITAISTRDSTATATVEIFK